MFMWNHENMAEGNSMTITDCQLRVALFNTLLGAGCRGHHSALADASLSMMLRPGWW